MGFKSEASVAHYVYRRVICKERTAAQARKFRESLGVTITQVAKQMGCSMQWIYKLERGEKGWSQETCDRFTKACHEAAKVKR